MRNRDRDFDPTIPNRKNGYFARMKDRYYVPLFIGLVSLGTLGFMLFLGMF